ncbi:MAG: restriction endonuclease, partial [Chloroflexota bacterium]
MDPIVFEHLTAALFERRGYETETTIASGDEGVDVTIRKGDTLAVVQCKRYEGSVGQPTIRDLYGTMFHNNADEAYLVTTAMLTRQAQEWAQGKPIHLIDGFTLVEWIMESKGQSAPDTSAAAFFQPEPEPSADEQPVYASYDNEYREEYYEEEPRSRMWLWALLILLILVFGVGTGIAFTRLSNRFSPTAPPIQLETNITPVTNQLADGSAKDGTGEDGTGEDGTGEDGTGESDGSLDGGAVITSTGSLTETASTEGATEDSAQTPVSQTTPTDVLTLTPLSNNAAPNESATNEPTPTNTVVPTATPTIKPTETPTEVVVRCPIERDPALSGAYFDELGCATKSAETIWAAWEPFERGYMLWRSDTNTAYAFYVSSNLQWIEIEEQWNGRPLTSRGEPPTGLIAPERGFGYVWGIRDNLYQNLGWATDQEKGFCALVQPFEAGFILESNTANSCTSENLFNYARESSWQPILLTAYNMANNRGVWYDINNGLTSRIEQTAQTEPNQPTPSQQSQPTANSTDTRPVGQGVFSATAGQVSSLDGQFDDWGSNWTPIQSIVSGAENHQGQGDLSGAFQLQWSRSGLYFAVRVVDERHRSGPDGTLMWRGDGLEIHFDRELESDYNETTVGSDDYQIGVSYGPNLDTIRIYRWYPYDKERPYSVPGNVRATAQGYNVEILLPWEIFDVRGGSLSPNIAFGFNISINDNDSDTPAQETVLSASP